MGESIVVIKDTDVVEVGPSTSVDVSVSTGAPSVTPSPVVPTIDVTVDEDTVEIAFPGPKGDTGPAGAGGAVLTGFSGEALSAGRAVYFSDVDGRVYKWNPINPALIGRLAGVTRTSASGPGEEVEIAMSGEITGLSGISTDAPLFVQSDSSISSTVPVSGILQQVGVGKSATVLLVVLSEPILLS